MNNEFARSLQRKLDDRGIKQTQLAVALDVSENTVSSWITGTYSPKSSRLPEIARVLGTSVGVLLEERESRQSEERAKPGKSRRTASDDLVQSLAALELESTAAKLAAAAPDLLKVLKQAERLSREFRR
jgi:transcriptional regulator with XRE-family HTH domain